MTQEDFTKTFLTILNKDSPKILTTTSYRTLTDEEITKLVRHLYEWFQHEARFKISADDLVTALLKTRRSISEQDRAEAMSRILMEI